MDTIDQHIEALTSRPPRERANAARALGLSRFDCVSPAAVDALARALSDPDVAVRSAAATALSSIARHHAPAVRAVARLLSDPSEEVRRAAAHALAGLGRVDVSAVDDLVRALSAPEDEVRSTAAHSLEKVALVRARAVAAPAIVDILVRALSDPHEPVVYSAALVFGHIVREDPSAVSAPAVEALARIRAHSNPSMRADVARTLGQLAQFDATVVVEALTLALSDPNLRVRCYSLQTLAEIAGDHPPVVDTFVRTLSDPDPFMREAAARALDNTACRHPHAVEALARTLSDPHADVRLSAARALSGIAWVDPSALAAPGIAGVLVRALADPDERVRYDAVSALQRITQADASVVSAPAVAAFARALADPNVCVRMNTANALGNVAPVNAAAFCTLVRALSSPRREVPAAPFEALEQVCRKDLGSLSDEPVKALVAALDHSGARDGAAQLLTLLAEHNPSPVLCTALPALKRHAAREPHLETRAALLRAAAAIENATAHLRQLPAPAASPTFDIGSLPRTAAPESTNADQFQTLGAGSDESCPASERPSWLSRLVRR